MTVKARIKYSKDTDELAIILEDEKGVYTGVLHIKSIEFIIEE